MAVKFTANRNYPSIPAITGDVDNHTRVLQAIKEALEIGQRRTNDLLNSFVRVKELIDLGLITLEGNSNSFVGADLSQISNVADLTDAAEGDFLRLRSGNWNNDTLYPTDIPSTFVTQHQALLVIAASQITSGIIAATRLGSGVPDTTKYLRGDGQWATYKEQTVQKTATWVNGVNPIVAGDAPVVAVHVPVACTIHQAVIVTRGGPGNCVVEVRRTTLGAYGAGTLISNNLGLSSQSATNDTTLTGWTTSLAADDVLLFELVSTSNFNYIHVSLTLR
jgi:hypothetical protein